MQNQTIGPAKYCLLTQTVALCGFSLRSFSSIREPFSWRYQELNLPLFASDLPPSDNIRWASSGQQYWFYSATYNVELHWVEYTLNLSSIFCPKLRICLVYVLVGCWPSKDVFVLPSRHGNFIDQDSACIFQVATYYSYIALLMFCGIPVQLGTVCLAYSLNRKMVYIF